MWKPKQVKRPDNSPSLIERQSCSYDKQAVQHLIEDFKFLKGAGDGVKEIDL